MPSRFISNANWHISLCFSSFLWTSGQRQILAYTTWGNPFRVATCNVSNGWHYNVPPTSAQNLALNKSTMQVRHLLHCTSNFFVSSRDATLCNVRVCLSVCLLAYFKNHVQTSLNSWCKLHMPIAKTYFDDNAMHCIVYTSGFMHVFIQ